MNGGEEARSAIVTIRVTPTMRKQLERLYIRKRGLNEIMVRFLDKLLAGKTISVAELHLIDVRKELEKLHALEAGLVYEVESGRELMAELAAEKAAAARRAELQAKVQAKIEAYKLTPRPKKGGFDR